MIFRDPVSSGEGRGPAGWRSPDAVALSRRRPATGQEEVARKGPARRSSVCSFSEVGSNHPVSISQAVPGPGIIRPVAVPPLPPLPPGTYVQPRPFSRSGAGCRAAQVHLTFPVSPKKQNSHRPLYTRMEQHRPRSSVVQAETGTEGGAPDREEKERWEGQREPCLQSPSLCACPGRQLQGLSFALSSRLEVGRGSLSAPFKGGCEKSLFVLRF